MSTLVEFPSSLPTAPISQELQAIDVAASIAIDFEHLDFSDFKEDGLWRDVFALTGTLRTFYGATIIKAWHETSKKVKPTSFTLDPKSAHFIRLPTGNAWLEVQFSFETNSTPQATCSGILSLTPGEDGKWVIWVMRTLLEQFKGQPNVDALEVEHEKRLTNGLLTNGSLTNGSLTNGSLANGSLTNGSAANGSEPKTGAIQDHFDCVVIGAGQAGLSMGGRLKALGISYVVLDKHKKVGDNWMTRYGSARLHTVREYAHLPFERTFPLPYQEFLTKDDLAKGYQDWVSKFDINVWTDSDVKSGLWDTIKKFWTINIRKEDGTETSITSAFVVVAAGGGGQFPRWPEYPNKESFKGVAIHSADYRDAIPWKGKHGVVIGTANTAHDVAEDMVDAGLASVTMVQRSQTYVLPVEYYKKFADLSYNSKVPTDLADRSTLTTPMATTDLTYQAGLHSQARNQPERFDALEKAGFKLERYGNVTDCLYNRQGGHYIDIGASQKISQGLIKMKGDSLPIKYTPEGLEFTNGSQLKADFIVFATGFIGNMRYLVKDVFGEEVADQMGDFFGLDREGELKGAFKPCGHPAMWYHGGTIGQARYMSRFIALQIKAKLLGTPLPLYEKTP